MTLLVLFVDLMVMFKIHGIVLDTLRRISLPALRPRRRHVARRLARPLPALLLPAPRLWNREFLVVLFMLLMRMTYAL